MCIRDSNRAILARFSKPRNEKGRCGRKFHLSVMGSEGCFPGRKPSQSRLTPCQLSRRASFMRANPVSYTHLDVYKRQVFHAVHLVCTQAAGGFVHACQTGVDHGGRAAALTLSLIHILLRRLLIFSFSFRVKIHVFFCPSEHRIFSGNQKILFHSTV